MLIFVCLMEGKLGLRSLLKPIRGSAANQKLAGFQRQMLGARKDSTFKGLEGKSKKIVEIEIRVGWWKSIERIVIFIRYFGKVFSFVTPMLGKITTPY